MEIGWFLLSVGVINSTWYTSVHTTDHLLLLTALHITPIVTAARELYNFAQFCFYQCMIAYLILTKYSIAPFLFIFQTFSHPPTQIESRLPMNQERNQAVKTNQLKLATIGIVKRLWQSGDKTSLCLLNEKLSWVTWCLKMLQEDGDHTKDIRLAVVECLPVVLSKWPWRYCEIINGSQSVQLQ